MSSARVNCDVRGIMVRIEQVGERAVKHVSDVMRDYGEVMLHDALANAPRDTGSLESALKIEYLRNGINGRLAVKVWIDPNTPYIDPNPNHKPSSKTVGAYAWLMEKYLLPHGDGGFNAQDGTLAKGPQAGGKYLERAVEKYRDALIERAHRIVQRAVK